MNGKSVTEDKIFNNNPIYMKSLLGKSVQIILVDDEVIKGIVYVVDPVFKNVVIQERDHLITRIILYHAIKSVTVISDERIENIENIENVQTKSLNNVELNNRKTILKERFQNMCLHVEESGECLKIDDNLIIVPPYGPENCICNNTLILERIQNIINIPFDTNS